MSGPLVGVLALQGDVAEHERALSACGVETSRVRTVEELAAVDGLVLPGGESTTMSALATTFGLMYPLRERIATGMPAYGSCAGMILLADRVLDGRADRPSIGGLDVTVRRNAFGRQVDSFEAPVRVQDVEGPTVTAVFIRAPWVEEIGPGVEPLGRVESGPAAGRIVAVREGGLLATSFHPELTGDIRVHELFVRMVRAAV